jgi:ribonuclease G
MDNPRHRRQVTAALKTAVEHDRMKTRIMHITRLGLVEMTRKRTGQSLAKQLQMACPCCNGTGRLLAPEAMAGKVLEGLRQAVLEEKGKAYVVKAHTQVALQLVGPGGAQATGSEERFGCPVYFRADEDMHPEDFEVIPGEDKVLRKQYLPYRKGQKLVIKPEQVIPDAGENLVALGEGGIVIEVAELANAPEGPINVRIAELSNSHVMAAPADKGR